MTAAATQGLHNLLSTFDAKRLGEGNVVAGANVLAAMACAIANVHRRGVCLTGSDGSSFNVGSSLLASGSLTATLIRERVLAGLAEIQSNLLSHIHEWGLAKQAIIEGTIVGAPDLRKHNIKPDASSLVVMNDDAPLRDACIEMLFAPFPNQAKRALLNHPLVFVTGATPAKLHHNLERCHLGKPLVHAMLNSPAQCADLSECCLPVIDGTMTTEEQSVPIHGHVLLSDPSSMLNEVVRTGGANGRWLTRLPWLVDGSAGPEVLPLDNDAANQPRLDQVEQRYVLAMHKAWRNRLDHTVTTPLSLAINMSAYQEQWIHFLGNYEQTLPGISAAARPLLATLVFGLYEMANSMPVPTGYRFNLADVVALAGLLVQRMCNANSSMVRTREEEKKLHTLQRVLEKLEDGPMCTRDIGRRLHRMSTPECRNLLFDLRRNGRVVELSGDRWQLPNNHNPSEPATLSN